MDYAKWECTINAPEVVEANDLTRYLIVSWGKLTKPYGLTDLHSSEAEAWHEACRVHKTISPNDCFCVKVYVGNIPQYLREAINEAA